MTDILSSNIAHQLTSHAIHGDLAGIANLLALGADPNASQSVALRCAASNGHLECAKLLISAEAPSPTVVGAALLAAASSGHASCVSLLMALCDPKEGSSRALRAAAANNHTQCVKLLLPASAPKAKSSEALSSAARAGNLECLLLLMPASSPTAAGSRALRFAARHGCPECFRTLLPASAPLIKIEGILSEAIDFGHAQILSIMLSHERRLIDSIDLPAAISKANSDGRSEVAAILSAAADKRLFEASLFQAPESNPSPRL